jgi:hypothetical protein
MWKSACVLAGSIAEAALIDYITVLGDCSASEEELTAPCESLTKLIDAAIGIDSLANSLRPPTGWGLKELTDAGEKARKSDSESAFRTSYLMSSAVASFRNLIHPGRSLRLKERVDENTSLAARAFVDRLLDDLRMESASRYPYTADDLLAKAHKDDSAQTVLVDMTHKTRPAEITRLLADVAPNAFVEDLDHLKELSEEARAALDGWDEDDIREYKMRYGSAEADRKADVRVLQLVLDRSTQEQRIAGLHAIARLLKNQDSTTIVAIETELFRISDLDYAANDDRKLIIGDVLDRICSKSADRSLLESVVGIGRWISPDRASEFAKALLDKRFLPRVEADVRRAAFNLLDSEYWNMSEETQKPVYRAVEEYRDHMAAQTRLEGDMTVINDLLHDWELLAPL